MNARLRLWPRRMAGQLAMLMLLGLLLSNLFAMLILQRNGSLLHPQARSTVVERLALAYQGATQLPGEDARRLLRMMAATDSQFSVATTPRVEPFAMHPEERRLARALHSGLGLPAGTQVVMQLERTSGSPARGQWFLPASWSPLRLLSSVALPDGRWLNSVQHPAGAYEWDRLLSYSLPVTSVPVLLIVVLFMRRVLRPIKQLAQATRRVSCGEWIAPLPLRGTTEACELTHAFNLMQERIARHVEGRTRMLAAISHDLNTPITELRLQVELLDDPALREDMLASLDELRGMVGETLDFVRDDALQEATVPCDLHVLLDDLARRYQTLGRPIQWSPSLSSSTSMSVYCRPMALKRALTNLIDNALNHAGDAELSLRRDPDHSLRIEIRDHGPGLDALWLEQVFEPFVQQHPAQGNGLGLGLAIARACVQAHGGQLTLENRDPGLCAVVHLPGLLDQGPPVSAQKRTVVPNQKVRP